MVEIGMVNGVIVTKLKSTVAHGSLRDASPQVTPLKLDVTLMVVKPNN